MIRKSGLLATFIFISHMVYSQHGSRIEASQNALERIESSVPEKSPYEDTDNDCVFDHIDQCPDIQGPETNNGCPKITVEVWTLFHKALTDVRFNTGTDTLTASSKKALSSVADFMKKNREYKLKISGYTDSTGEELKNEILAHDRAIMVKKYLTQRGVPARRIKIASFGEKLPKASNQNGQGRAENRRVEFEVFY